MSKKCKYCYTKNNDESISCSLCKIDLNKGKKELTKEEKKIWYHCRTLNIIAFFAALGGVFGAVGSIAAIAGLTKEGKGSVMGIVVSLVLAVSFFIFGVSLSRYKKLCYLGGIILYSLAIVLNLYLLNIIPLLFSILFLYYIASKTTKNILYGEL